MSASGLSWDAMLDIAKIELEFIIDVDKFLRFAKCMRGGVSYISKRYSKANTKYVTSYNPKEETKHIIYLNANKFYD